MSYLHFDFPHTRNQDSDLRQIIEMYYELRGLPKSFSELKNFVENYFSALDVSEEINKKIEDMLEKGTLDDVIQETVNTWLESRRNIFVISSDYGVSSGSSDNAEAMQALIDAGIAQNKPIYILPGKYIIRSRIAIKLNQEYFGNNKFTVYGNNATIFCYGCDAFDIWNDNAGDLTKYRYFGEVSIKDLHFDGDYNTLSTKIALRFGSMNNLYDSHSQFTYLENVTVQNFGTAFGFVNARHFCFNACCVRDSDVGIQFSIGSTDTNGFSGDCVFTNCEFVCNRLVNAFKNNSGSGYVECRGIHFTSCYFYQYVATSIFVNFDSASVRMLDWFFKGCQFDQIESTVFGISNSFEDANLKGDVYIDGCWAIGLDNSFMIAYLANGIHVTNSRIGAEGAPFIIGGCKNVHITDNNIDLLTMADINASNSVIISNNIFNASGIESALSLANNTLLAVTGNTFNVDEPITNLSGSGYNISGNASNNTNTNQYM